MDELMRKKPWIRTLLELLRHSEIHYIKSCDFDRRISLIGFDNTIEVAITTFLNAHPSLRSDIALKKEDVKKWKRNFHGLIEFAVSFFPEMPFEKNTITYYHTIRNELYHEGKSVTPTVEALSGIRDVAYWVVSNLYKVDDLFSIIKDSLSQDEISVDGIEEKSEKLEFLKAYEALKEDLKEYVDNVLESQQKASGEALQRIDSLLGLEGISSSLDIAKKLEEDISLGKPLKSNLEEVTSSLERMHLALTKKLRPHQNDVVSALMQGILSAKDEQSKQGDDGLVGAGIVRLPIGTGATVALTSLIVKILSTESLRDYKILILSDNMMTLSQTAHSLNQFKELKGATNTVVKSKAEFASSVTMTQNRMIFSTISNTIHSKEKLIILSNGIRISKNEETSLRANFPSAIIGLISSAPSSSFSDIFGELIYSYDLNSAINDGLLLPYSLEKRESDETLITDDIVEDLINNKTPFKSLVVCKSIDYASKLYDTIITKHPQFNECFALNTTKSILYNGEASDEHNILSRFRDPESKLKVTIVVDKWLVGTDIPVLGVIYLLRKFRQPHGLMQAISRVNRHYEGKDSCKIIDYCDNSFSFDESIILQKYTTSDRS